MATFDIQGDGDNAVATVAGLDLSTFFKIHHATVNRGGIVTSRFSYNAPINWAKAKLNIEAHPDELGIYTYPRRPSLVGVTITAVPGQWSLHKFDRETGELIDVERHPADGPGITAFRRATSLAKPPRDGGPYLAIVLVEPLNVTPAPQTEE